MNHKTLTIHYRNRSWPAVSQICNLIDLPLILTTFEPNSTPIV